MPLFDGIWPALVTPFTEDDQVNVPVLRELVEYLIDKRVDGFFVGGTTGEGIYSSLADRQLVVKTVLDQVAGRMPVIVHVGAVASGDARSLAGHARSYGAAGISSILPPLYGDWSVLHHYFDSIAQAAPDLPLFAYLLLPNYDAAGLVRELAQIPSFAGAKYTGPNMYEMRKIIDMGSGAWSIWSGMDEQCVYAAMMGATGAIGSTLNIMPNVYRTIRELVQQGAYAEAQTLQVKANRVIAAMSAQNFQGSLKELLTASGFPCGMPRLPYLPLSTQQRDTLYRDLAETDFEALTKL